MKQDEVNFFKHCIEKHEYKSYNAGNDTWFRKIVPEYSEKTNVPEKRLWYFLEKWERKGFIQYGTSIAGAWFEFDNLVGEYKNIYDDMKGKTDE